MPGQGGRPWIDDRRLAEQYFEQHEPAAAAFRRALYAQERYVHYGVGTALLYREDTWHRGTPLAPGARRIVENMEYRCTPPPQPLPPLPTPPSPPARRAARPRARAPKSNARPRLHRRISNPARLAPAGASEVKRRRSLLDELAGLPPATPANDQLHDGTGLACRRLRLSAATSMLLAACRPPFWCRVAEAEWITPWNPGWAKAMYDGVRRLH